MKKANHNPILLVNIGQLITLQGPPGPRRGSQLKELAIIPDAAVLLLGGKIVSVGTTRSALRDPWLARNRRKVTEIDCSRQVVLPGFVDAHTHPAFMTPRLVDFEKRASGASYEGIAESGGGIRSSLEGVRNATRTELADRVLNALLEMSNQGTTCVEAKSGYGLSVAAELKSLQAIRDAAARWPGTVVSTLLGAHLVPPEFRDRSQNYVQTVCSEMIPGVARRNLASFVDVFTERGAFSPDETEMILKAATQHSLPVRVHVCQLSHCSVKPFLKYNPASLDHLDHVLDDDIVALAKTDTVATLVPGSNYFLGLDHYPPARRLIDEGAAVALATDYNPGTSPTPSMPFVLSLACTHMKMTPAEAIAAATINGAHSLRLAHKKGSIEAGKDADLAVFNVSDYREIPYWFASNHCSMSIMNGIIRSTAENPAYTKNN